MEKYDERLNQHYHQGQEDFAAGRYDPPFADAAHRHRGLTEEEEAVNQAYRAGWEDAQRLQREG